MKLINAAYLIAFITLPFLANAQVFNFILSGSQATTLGTPTGSAGFATVELKGSNLNWMITYEGTTASNAHFHGPAGVGVPAGVALGIGSGASPLSGSASLTGGQLSDLLAGNWYVNIHTAENGVGELRGQVVQQLAFTPNTLLSGSQVVGVNAVASAGAALVTFNPNTNLLSWDIAFEGLEGTVSNMHFHGPAAAGAGAGVALPISHNTGVTSDILSGSATLDQTQADDLTAGLWYINIHSTAFGGGELRGQVVPTIVPEPSTVALMFGIAALGACMYWRRKSS